MLAKSRRQVNRRRGPRFGMSPALCDRSCDSARLKKLSPASKFRRRVLDLPSSARVFPPPASV
ncbi:hypothetical protein BVG81_005220 [Haliangium sp. UPWRP_2]|nr:hypothetical protein BVG81_005220 [Haliangium sp. UPWRP_2]